VARVRARRFIQRYRRGIAAGLLVLAAISAVRPLTAAEASGVRVAVLSRTLNAGDVVRDRDVTMLTVPASVLPDDALTESAAFVGQRLSVAASAGEILTPSRLLTGSIAADGGEVVTPVRIADPQIAALLRVGDVVDVLAASSSSSAQARVVASAARVVGSPSSAASANESTGSRLFGSTTTAFDNGGLVLLAVDTDTAAALAGAAASARLSITVRPQP
jgi:Flp pilus assembly protein CpaB